MKGNFLYYTFIEILSQFCMFFNLSISLDKQTKGLYNYVDFCQIFPDKK